MEGKRNLINAKRCNYIQLQFSVQACVKYIKISFYPVCLTSSSNGEGAHMAIMSCVCPLFLFSASREQPYLEIQMNLVAFQHVDSPFSPLFPFQLLSCVPFFPSHLLVCRIPVSPGSLCSQSYITFTIIHCFQEANLDHCWGEDQEGCSKVHKKQSPNMPLPEKPGAWALHL